MDKQTKVTVIVPVYNVEKYLERFLDSLLRQTMQDFNVIAVNDASTDRSRSILDDYLRRFDDRLHIIDNPQNMTLGPSRNIGLESEYCTGEYISFVDSDDELSDKYLEKMTTAAEQHNADIVMCGFERVKDKTNEVLLSELPLKDSSKYIIDAPIDDIRLAFCPTFVWNKLFRKDIIDNNRFTSMKRSECTIFFLQVLLNAKKIVCIDDILYTYRIRNDSLTGLFNIDGLRSQKEGIQYFVKNYKHNYSDELWEIAVVQIYLRCGIGAMSRLHLPLVEIRRLEKECVNYFDEVIPEWRKTTLLGARQINKRSFKENIFAGTRLLYKLHCFWIFVSIYHLLVDVRG